MYFLLEGALAVHLHMLVVRTPGEAEDTQKLC